MVTYVREAHQVKHTLDDVPLQARLTRDGTYPGGASPLFASSAR
jgi:hypothetical protein